MKLLYKLEIKDLRVQLRIISIFNCTELRIDPLTNLTREDLPQCLGQCLDEPLTRSDVSKYWTGLVSHF